MTQLEPARTTLKNTRWVLKQHPVGQLDVTRDFEQVVEEWVCSDAECGKDTVVVAVDMLSVDAFLRTMLDPPKPTDIDNGSKDEAFHGSCQPRDTIPAIGYGRVVWCGSAVPHWLRRTFFRRGASVIGLLGAQQIARMKYSQIFPRPSLPFVPPSTTLGLLGLTTGFTAWMGLYAAAKPPGPHDTVLISAASGAVGSIAAQLAKRTNGARVIGVAGGPTKTRYLLNSLGLDAAVDYKATTVTGHSTLAEQLDVSCPHGIDFFYDNVGGELLDAVLRRLKPGARVVVCGAASQYNTQAWARGEVVGPTQYLKLAERGASMHGFVVSQFGVWTFLKAVVDLTWAYARGQVNVTETVHSGIEAFPEALNKLFTGRALGKMLVDVSVATS